MLEGKGKLLTKFRALKDKEQTPQRKQCEELSVPVRHCSSAPLLKIHMIHMIRIKGETHVCYCPEVKDTAVLQRRVF